MALPKVTFGLLGPVEAAVDGRCIALTGKQRTLLALLLLHANQPVSVGRITEVLWDGRPPASASARVRALIAELRRACGEWGREVVVTRSPGYLVRVEPGALDTGVFQELVERARRALREDRPEAAVPDYTAALDMWRGAPLADVSSACLEAARRWLAERRLTALEDRAAATIRLGAFGQAIEELQPLVADHALRERLRAQLMTALWRSGRQIEALQAYRDFRARLVEETGVEPTEELRALHQRILTSDTGGPPQPTAPRHTDRAAAAHSGLMSVPRLLPAGTGCFVEREAEWNRLDELSGEESRLILVVGPAGAGKTSLAVEWARCQAERFPDGQLFLEMRGFDASENPMTSAEALPLLLRALGTPAVEIPHQMQGQVQLYRSLTAVRRALVLLDDVSGPEQVRALLPGGSSCLTVVTSRDRLAGLVALNGASRVDLDVLTHQQALELLGHRLGAPRMNDDPETADDLARQCGRLPLALAIAAARLADQPHRTLGDYAAELKQRGRLARLRIEGDETVAVQGALDVSYGFLPADARRLLRLIGLVPGSGVTTTAAAVLAGVAPAVAEDLLESIARVHLIHSRAARRYACHDLVREFAADRAQREESEEERACALRRLYDYYLRSVMEVTRVAALHELALPYDPVPGGVEPEVFSCADEAFGWVDSAWEDLSALITQAAEGTLRPMSWLLMDALLDVLHHRRPLAEWVRLGELVVAGARAEGDLLGQAASHLSLAYARWRMADLETAREDYRRACEFSRSVGWRPGEAAALRGRGVVLKQLGDPQGSVPLHRSAIAAYRSQGDVLGESASLNNLASAYLTLGELPPAEKTLESVLPLVRRTKNHNLEVIALVNLGLVRQERGLLDSAQAVLREALALAECRGITYALAVTHETLGRVHNDAGRRAEAVDAFTEALTLAERVENRNCQVDALAGLAAAQSYRDDVATGYVDRALEIAHHTGHHTGLIDVLLSSAEVHRHAGRVEEAEESAGHALRLALDGGPLGTSRAHRAMAAVLLDQERWAAALHEGHRAVQAAEQSGQSLVKARALVCIGHAHQRNGRTGEAVRTWRTAYTLLAAAGSLDQQVAGALLAHWGGLRA